jgi:preprotein translocase SecE subunit
MARQTRAQRRARRQAQADSRAQAGVTAGQAALPGGPPAPPRPPTARDDDRSEPDRERGEIVEHVPGRGFFRFVRESWGELKKVDWPGQSQVIQATTVVILACAIVGTYLWGADLVLKRLVEKIFLGQ